MGNCLSKYPVKVELDCFRGERKRKGSFFLHKLEEKALRSVGVHAVNEKTILTPVNDRFPAQACDLIVHKFRSQLIGSLCSSV